MHYSDSLSVTGDSQRAAAAAATILMTNGFTVVQQTAERIEFAGPGLSSTRQNPILGASRVVVHIEEGRLRLDAELGGVDSLRRFMIRFPLLLGVGLGITLAGAGIAALVGIRWFGGDPVAVPQFVWWTPLLAFAASLVAVSPWIFPAPWLRRHLTQRTTSAIDALLANACHAAGTI